MRVITEDYLRKLADKGLLTIIESTRTEKEVTVRWGYDSTLTNGEKEHLLITQNQ